MRIRITAAIGDDASLLIKQEQSILVISGHGSMICTPGSAGMTVSFFSKKKENVSADACRIVMRKKSSQAIESACRAASGTEMLIPCLENWAQPDVSSVSKRRVPEIRS